MANLAPRTFVDDLGRKIFLAKPPARIVSLAPSVTETLYAIGRSEQVVGVTPFCDYPSEAQLKPKVGYSSPDLQEIQRLQPELVLASKLVVRTGLLREIEQLELKIPVFVREAKSVEAIVSYIQTLGRMLECSRAADGLAMEMRQRIAKIQTRTEPFTRLRVLYVLSIHPLITVGPGSFLHQLVELAGGTNVAAPAGVAYPRPSREEVLEWDPDRIILSTSESSAGHESDWEAWHRWAKDSALEDKPVCSVPAHLVNRPGPRITEGLELLAKQLHPQAFEGIASSASP